MEEGAGPKDGDKKHVPRIGVSGVHTTSKFYSASVAAMMAQIRAAGAEPVYIGDHQKRIKRGGGDLNNDESINKVVKEDLEKLDGLVIMGNDGDIDPRDYGEKKIPETKPEEDMERKKWETAAIKQILSKEKESSGKPVKKMPLLGVCGGMQRINVLGNGTLIQHVPDVLPEITDPSDPTKTIKDMHHSQGVAGIPPFVPVQLVHIEENTRLAKIADGTHKLYTPTHQGVPPGVVMENSFHHQAVDKVRGDFQVCAASDDDYTRSDGGRGIIEAIEPKPGQYEGQYVMGVQWHPEFGASDLGPKLIKSVVGAARKYAVDHERTEPVAPHVDTGREKMSWQVMVQNKRVLLQKEQDRIVGRW